MGMATLKMKNYAEEIADYLGIDPPDFDDFEETRDFIDEYRMEYLRARQDQTGELRSPHLILGDCAEQMRDLAPNSIDAIVTDPPYGLNFMGMDFDNPKMMGQSPVMHGGLQRYNKGEERTGYADCDNAKFQSYLTPIFAEALRVAKPGAHLLAFGGTRTYHRLACAIEDAGWEIRDCIMWVYGSGFPKSMDVAKAIAKRAGGDIEARNAIEFMRIRREKLGLSRNEFEKRIFGRSDGNVRNWEDGISLPKPELWPSIKKAMELDETPFDSVMDRGDMEVAIKKGSFGYQKDGVRWEREQILREATTDMAKQWQGWGTCLKPAVEPIVVARKPFDGTVAANVLKYGTGAINIDGCRVPTEDVIKTNGDRDSAKGYGKYNGMTPRQFEGQKLGRFPANLIHDGSSEVLALFPESNGGAFPSHSNVPTGKFYGGGWGNVDNRARREMGVGSAARFFYCAKASRAERGEGNVHPTVKPIALMRYLVRLVTRKGGTVLDPFMGSGSTGVAAIQEGMQFIGIERDQHYMEIATRRISAAKPEPPTPTQQELPL